MTVLDSGPPRNVLFVLFLGTRSRAPFKAKRKAYQDVIDSLRVDATRRCGRRADGTPALFEVPGLETPPSVRPAHPPSADFDPKKAESGCALLQTMFVPIDCVRAPVGGEDAFLVLFQKGRQPASQALDQLSRYVTVPFCWASRDHADAPHLLMGAQDLDVLREYDCEKHAFTRTIHPPDQSASGH